MLLDYETLANWIMEHKRGKAWRGYDKNAVIAELQEAQKSNGLIIDLDPQGNIQGIIVAEPRLYIKQILTTKQGVMKRLARALRQYYPFCKWVANRHDKVKQYDVDYTILRCGVEFKKV